jgi:hypothetical protein
MALIGQLDTPRKTHHTTMPPMTTNARQRLLGLLVIGATCASVLSVDMADREKSKIHIQNPQLFEHF